MSTTIDQRIVEMRFDNKQFESNVQTSMSTLEKLKQKLNLSGASKGLSDLDAAAKKVDMSGLGNAVETVQAKFSSLDVIGATALANLTNSAVEAGKKIVNALFIDPVKMGFNEYELKMDSIKTIMASTGESVDVVNGYLEELNKYSDQTIYSFSDMTQNIGKFTNAGVKLEDAVLAIKGISNEAAVSGANANEASRAMYNFAQALSAGYVKLIDWKSIENANMATMEFKQQLIDTAVELGTVTKSADGMYETLNGKSFTAIKDFNETLQDQWMTTDVLVTTLGKYADETTEIGKKAFAAAQDVTKLTQMFDVLKETAQSGWAKTWEILFGDIEQAKAIFTPLTNFFGGIIDKISDFRNAILESALSKNFVDILDKLKNGLGPVKKALDAVNGALLDYDKVVNEIIAGKWGNMYERWDALTAAGYDWKHAQNLVNEKLNNSLRRATDYKEVQQEVNDVQEEAATVASKLTNAEKSRLVQLSQLSDEQLRMKGFTDEFITALRTLQDVSDKTGIPLRKFLDNIEEINGRWLIVEGFKNIGKTFLDIFGAVGDAFNDAFSGLKDGIANAIFNAIAAFHKFSTKLLLSKETVDKLTRTFKGLFAIIDIIATVTGSAFKVVFKIVQEVAKAFGYLDFSGLADGILSVTAYIGDSISMFRDWLEEHNLIYRAIELLVPMVVNFGKALEGMVRGFLQLPAVQFTIDRIYRAFEVLGELLGGIGSIIDEAAIALGELNSVDFSDVAHVVSVSWGRVQKTFNEWLESHPKIKAAVGVVQDAFVALGNKLGEVFNAWLDKHPQLKASIEGLKNLFGPLVSNFSEAFTNIRNLIGDTVSEFLNMSEYDFSDVREVFSTIFTGIGQEIENLISKSPMLYKLFTTIKSAFSKFGGAILDIAGLIKGPFVEAFDYLKSLDTITFDGIKEAFRMIAVGIYQAFTGMEEVPENLADGFVQGLKAIAGRVGAAMGQLARDLLAAFREVLGIHSPSDETKSDGENVGLGFIEGLGGVLGAVIAKVKEWGVGILDAFRSLDWGKIFAAGTSLGIVYIVKKISDTLGMLASPLDGLGSVLEGAGAIMLKASGKIRKILNNVAKVVRGFARVLNSLSFKITAAAIKDIAIAIAILVASVLLLTLVDDTKKLWNAVGVIGALAVILVGLAAACKMMSSASVSITKEGIKMASLSGTLIALGLALLAMAFIIKIVGNLSPGQAIQGFIGLAVMIGALAAVFIVFGKTIKNYNAMAFKKFGSTLVQMAAALLIMAVVMKILAKMEWVDLGKAGAGLLGMVAILGIMMTLNTGTGFTGFGTTLLQAAAALGILAIIAKIIAGMEWSEMGKAAVGLLGLVGIIKLMMLAVQTSIGIETVGITLIQIAGAMAILAIVAKIIASMEWGDMAKAAVGLVGLALILRLMITAINIGVGETERLAITLIQIAGAMAILAIVAKIMASMTWGDMAKGLVGVAALAGIITGLVAATRLYKPTDLAKVGTTLLLASVAIGILAAVALVLSLIDLAGLAKGVIAVGLLGSVLALMIHATKGAQNVKGSIMAMAVAIGIMAASIAVLSFIEPNALVGPTIAMGLLMGMFALIVRSAKGVTIALPTIAIMVGAIAILAGLLILMSTLNVESSIQNAAALSVLVVAMSAALLLLSKLGAVTIDALLGIGLLTLMAVPLLAFIGVLAVMNKVTIATENAMALTNMATALTLLLIPLTIIGSFGAFGLAGVLLLTAMAVPLLAFVGILALMNNIQNAEHNAQLLTRLMLTMTTVLIAVSAIAPLAVIGVGALTALSGLMVVMGTLAVAVGALMEKFPSLQKFLDTGIDILIQLANGLGRVIGAFITGFAGEVLSILPMIGKALSAFMIGAMPFINGIKMVDASMLEGVGVLTAAIIALSAADLIAGVTALLGGGFSFATLGLELSAFMMGAMPFINAMSDVDPAILQGVKALANAVLVLTAADLIDGISRFFGGGSSLAEFGKEIASFGPSLKKFADSVVGIDAYTVSVAANAAKNLSEMAANIPNSGGWLGKIMGENDAGEFGAQLEGLGKGMMSFACSVAGIESYTASIEASITAGKSLAELADAIPNSGGFMADFFGDNPIEAFASQLKGLGQSLMSYGAAVVGIENYTGSMEASISAAQSLAELADAIPNSGGFIADFLGDNTIDVFGTQLVGFGKSMLSYACAVAGIESFTGSINASVTAANSLGEIATSAKKIGRWDAGKAEIVKFGSDIVSFGKKMVEYSSIVSVLDVGSLSSATTQIGRLANMISGMSGMDFGGAASLKTAIKNLAQTSVNDMVDAFESAGGKVTKAINGMLKDASDSLNTNQASFSNAGRKLITQLAKGIDSSKSSVKRTVTSMISSVVTTIRNKYNSFYNAGKYVVTGFAAGITDNTWRAEAKAKAMAKAAIETAKRELQTNSPSKVFKAIGASVPEGFAMGIDKFSGMVSSSSTSMANTAIKNTKQAIARIADVMTSDIDAQPTIRPVLDLSNVSSGMGTISNLLNTNPTIGVSTNVSAISRMMAQRNQNGGNDDVVSAIDGLRGDLGNLGNTNYNINGITYTGESEIADAIRVLARAAIMERRI